MNKIYKAAADRFQSEFWMNIILVVLAALTTISMASYTIHLREKVSEQAVILEIWKNCPMPPPGFWLIIEADWVGKQPAEQLRCSFARQPTTPPQPRTY